MNRLTTWQEIRELDPPPSGVPLQVRCEFARPMGTGSIVLPLMFNGRDWRHINKSPEEPGAWLKTSTAGVTTLRPTHWQHFADPDLPALVYRVLERRYSSRGPVVAELAGGLTFDAAGELAAHARGFFSGLWSREVYPKGCAPQFRDFFIEREPDERDRMVDDLAVFDDLPGAIEAGRLCARRWRVEEFASEAERVFSGTAAGGAP